MTRFVIDPVVLVALAGDEVEVHETHQLVAPGSLRSRAESLLFSAVRNGDLDRDVALRRLERLTEIKVRLLNDRVSRSVAWKLAEQLGLDDTYAAEYLAVTRLQADALVAGDDGLARLADGVVPLAGVDALADA